MCLFAGGWTQNICRFFIHLMYESFVIMPRQHAKLRIHVVFFIKRIPTDVVCIFILFLLDLSSLNKDILFLS